MVTTGKSYPTSASFANRMAAGAQIGIETRSRITNKLLVCMIFSRHARHCRERWLLVILRLGKTFSRVRNRSIQRAWP